MYKFFEIMAVCFSCGALLSLLCFMIYIAIDSCKMRKIKRALQEYDFEVFLRKMNGDK